jgi:hypothetical protein
MPTIMFTVGEVLGASLETMRDLHDQILDLSDLTKRPLDPGESVAARHHKIAKLGKRLAETTKAMDDFVTASVGRAMDAQPVEPAGDPEPNPRAN